MIVGTAGHIDHGKTSLVKALTGVDTDRLKEEKARGITIDLGFAYRQLADGSVMGFVDVPGHERFVPTMLAGAHGIDFVVLVIAADDGVMPQTREHLQVLDLLGLDRGLVALTKADLVDADTLVQRELEIAELLAGTSLAGAEVFPVSTVTDAGVADLLDRLEAEAGEDRARDAGRGFRLAVDRSFTLQGAGTVVTGTVLGGRVAVGDTAVLSPAGLTVRVRSIHAQNRKAETAVAGDRAALNLVAPGLSKDAIRRGDMILAPSLHAPTLRIDAELRVLPGEPSRSSNGCRFGCTMARSRSARGSCCSAMRRGPAKPPTSSSCSNGRSRRRLATASCCATSRRAATSAAAASSTCARPSGDGAPRSAPGSAMPGGRRTMAPRSPRCWRSRRASSI
ncbi:selenocysteine-specific translation elongation factor [Methyloraptor flagellatus]|uniref:Selenocysteine-specific elongation factor n=1 Tax=Methyloraptor flagellatus TaxID=3162530 RepID=A0AAU7XFQ3_9HYPH